MTPTERHLAREGAFWSQVVSTREPYIFADNAEQACILELLGDVRGRALLDCGCGCGIWTVRLAERGAQVTAFDVSDQSVRVTLERARRYGVADRVTAQVMNLEKLAYADDAFDLVFGSMILHHVDADAAGHELSRVLRPGGKAVFHENSANNLVLMWARARLVGRWGIPKFGTPNEYPLTSHQIAKLSRYFRYAQVHFPRFMFFKLVSKYLFRERFILVDRICVSLDRLAYRLLPFVRRYSYQQILEFCR